MRQYRFHVFQETDHQTILHFYDSKGKLIGERFLPNSEIEKFIYDLERTEVINDTCLQQMGQRLYDWLDGSGERFLDNQIKTSENFSMQIDIRGKLRHLPWEILFANRRFLCSERLFTPIRYVSGRIIGADHDKPHNRYLRVLFMPSSPEGVTFLNYEAEEEEILKFCRKWGIELILEGSGSLEGLEEVIYNKGKGYFDIFHLTGHAGIDDDGPYFSMEDSLHSERLVRASDIKDLFAGMWPKLIFLSGCETSNSIAGGTLPSLCEKLVFDGAPAVLGWSVSVEDNHAIFAAAELYEKIAKGLDIDEAVARTRQRLLQGGSPYWHHLRFYANVTKFGALVTPPGTDGREILPIKDAYMQFIDSGSKLELSQRKNYVERRRPKQRCLKVLQSVKGDKDYAEGVLIHGMAGLGKTSLAVQLCQSMKNYEWLIFVGKIDETIFIDRIKDML